MFMALVVFLAGRPILRLSYPVHRPTRRNVSQPRTHLTFYRDTKLHGTTQQNLSTTQLNKRYNSTKQDYKEGVGYRPGCEALRHDGSYGGPFGAVACFGSTVYGHFIKVRTKVVGMSSWFSLGLKGY